MVEQITFSSLLAVGLVWVKEKKSLWLMSLFITTDKGEQQQDKGRLLQTGRG